jgi:serine/threonine-protein kinase
VIDRATELTWQRSGSPEALTYDDAEKYIHDLNKRKLAGYKDWRLPTLDETMSLLKPHKSGRTLYIDPVFDQRQKWIWTWDESDAGVSWVVTFRAGCCYVPSDSHYYVRAVRGEFWFPGNESLDEEALLDLIF